jgi:hypothetical protein
LIVAKVISNWKHQTPPAQPPLSAPAKDEKAPADPYQERFERELREYDAK